MSSCWRGRTVLTGESTGRCVRILPAARRAVFQLEKRDAIGMIRFDDVRITTSPNPDAGQWSPYEVADDTDLWLEVPLSGSIKPEIALDVSFLLDAPAGDRGPVTVKNGHLTFGGKDRARFFGVTLLSPAAFQRAEAAERLADRLARSGINLVRLGDLDTALGPDRSLFEDSRRHQGARPGRARAARPPDRRAQETRDLRGDRAAEQAPIPG